jgi:SnoaL-like domain
VQERGLVPERRVHRLGGDPGRRGDVRDRRTAVPLVDEQRLRGDDVDTPGGGRVTYTLRTTHVFRREDGEWRIVHRHGDRPPERGDFPIAPTPSTA